MKASAHGNPLIIKNGKQEILERVFDFSELEIQQLIFNHPKCLPVSDIDESYNPLIPVCMELRTTAGPLDILMITPNGDITIIETKLWRNPEARRKVVAQILDYAKEMATWSYSDLQREINRNLKTRGNHLYKLVEQHEHNHFLAEEDFCDAVSRNLRNGKFLLLIAGDGIREGAKRISDFLGSTGYLHFTLALVELPIYRAQDGTVLIYPRTLVKTVEIQKINIELEAGFRIVQDLKGPELSKKPEISPAAQKRREFYIDFWKECVSHIEFDDPEQPLPIPASGPNLWLYPGPDKYCWISCCFITSSKRVGVYFKFRNDQRGLFLKEHLSTEAEFIQEELPEEVIWYWDKGASGFDTYLYLEDLFAPDNRQTIIDFFIKWMNHYVNVIRPRLKDVY